MILCNSYTKLVSVIANMIQTTPLCVYLLQDTVVDHLSWFLRFLANNTLICLIAIIIIWLIITIFYIPLYIISFFITSYGSHLVLFISMIYILRLFGRSVAFPSSTTSMHTAISQDYMKRVIHQLIGINKGSLIFAQNFLTIQNKQQIYHNNMSNTSRNMPGFERDSGRLASQCVEIYRYGSTLDKFNEWFQECTPPMKVEVGEKTYHDLMELCKYLNIHIRIVNRWK